MNEKIWAEIIHDILTLVNSDFAVWNSHFSTSELRNYGDTGDLGAVLNGIFNKEATAQGKRAIVIKELGTSGFIPFLEAYFPNSKYIYLVRDPRDMALSWRESIAHSGGLLRGALQWTNDNSQYLKMLLPLIYSGRATIVKYEDLVTDTASTLKALCNFLGYQYESKMLEFYKDELTIKNSELKSAWSNLGRKVIASNAKKFESALSTYEVQVIERIVFELMFPFGYTPKSDWRVLSLISGADLREFESYETKSLDEKRVETMMTHEELIKRLRKRTPPIIPGLNAGP